MHFLVKILNIIETETWQVKKLEKELVKKK